MVFPVNVKSNIFTESMKTSVSEQAWRIQIRNVEHLRNKDIVVKLT